MSASDVVMLAVGAGVAIYLAAGVVQGYAWLLSLGVM